MRVANLDFGTEGAKSITIRVAATPNAGILVIRQDHARGKVLGRFRIESTGGLNVWEERTFDLTNTPTGTHSLHFSFASNSTETLFNWDWWRFNTSTTSIDKIQALANEGAPVFYTLQGTPVTQPTKGIYLHEGRKVMFQ